MIKKSMMMILFISFIQSSFAIEIREYVQYKKNNSTGEFIVSGLFGEKEINVEVIYDYSPLEIDLIQRNPNEVLVKITQSQRLKKNTFITIIASTPRVSTSRYFAINKVIQVPKNKDSTNSILVLESDVDLPEIEYSNETINTNAIEIGINEGLTILTVREATQFIADIYNLSLVELPGDEILLDQLIDLNVKTNTPEDLIKASNGAVKHIYIDKTKSTIRVVGKLPIYKIPKPDRTPTTLRMIVNEIALQESLSLIELPGDEILLDQLIDLNVKTNTPEDLIKASNGAVKHIYIDKTKSTIRVVGKLPIYKIPKPDRTPTTLRMIVNEIALQESLSLVELPGDEMLLDQLVLESISNLADLENSNLGIKHIMIDKQTKTMRVL